MRFFLGEIPIIFLLIVSIIYNKESTEVLKLYPLMIFLCGAGAFIAIYFFRAIKISFSEIRYIGKFSSKDCAVINEGKTLILRKKNRSSVDVELFGNDGQPPLFSDGEDTEPIDINLFRGRIIGGEAAITRILKFFGASAENAKELIASKSQFEYENVNISSHNVENGLEIRIFIKHTV